MMDKHSFRGSPPTPAQQSVNSTTTSQPWAPAQPFIQAGIEAANNYAAQGAPKYTPWSQAAQLDPLQLAAMKGVRQYTNAPGTQSLMSTATQGVQDLVSNKPNQTMQVASAGIPGLTGYIANNKMMDPAQAENQMAYGNNMDPTVAAQTNSALQSLSNNFQMNTLPGLRRTAIGNGSYGSSRNEMQEGQAAGALSSDMYNAANQIYGNAYNNQQSNSLAALQGMAGQQATQAGLANQLYNTGTGQQQTAQNIGLTNYQNALNAPLAMLQAQGGVGLQQQQQNQQQLNSATNAWNMQQNAPWVLAQQYANLIQPTTLLGQSSSGQSYSAQPAPQTNNAALATGGLLAGAGLAANMVT